LRLRAFGKKGVRTSAGLLRASILQMSERSRLLFFRTLSGRSSRLGRRAGLGCRFGDVSFFPKELLKEIIAIKGDCVRLTEFPRFLQKSDGLIEGTKVVIQAR